MPVTFTEPVLEKDEVICPNCKGNGVVSKYDLGWHSLYHDPALAALHVCSCGGSGKYRVEDGPPIQPFPF